jgi:conjugal transfer/entry exclusion protein
MAALVRSNQLSYEQLTNGTTSIGYTLNNVNAQYRSIFKSDFHATPLSDFDSRYARWHEEILASTEVASRSQSALATLQRNNEAAAAILRNSQTSAGVVGQLQAVNQMLGVIQSQNNTVIQSLTTTGRVLANVAGTQASERQLSREKKRRQLEGYRERGAEVPPMTKLP